MTNPVSGTILHIQRLSTEDGPGIRSTIFFKGCPLRCAWCHNPESFTLTPQVQWLENRCIGCKTCLNACPTGCLLLTPDGMVIDRLRCQGCGSCALECPANAMELLGHQATSFELIPELLKDRAFYEKSGGGVTLSGGEPALQASFARELLQDLKTQSIHTALDTCGLCSPQVLESLWPFIDLCLFDFKMVGSAEHILHTGHDNSLIIENLRWAARQVRNHNNKTLWVRTPLIPFATISKENIIAIGSFIADELEGSVSRWELCAFNNLCRDKYRRLGMEWVYQAAPLLTQGELHQAETWAKTSGVDPAVVFITGAAQT